MGFLAGSIKAAQVEWDKLNLSAEVQDWIKEGVKLPLSSVPDSFELPNHTLSRKQYHFVLQEISDLVTSGALEICSSKPHCVNPVGCVPKKGGKRRLITDLRKLNNHCATPKFRNEDINTVSDLIQPHDQLVTVDIKNGFYHVSIHEDFRDYLGIYFEGVYYRWTVLPFGLNCSPYFFNKVLRPVIEHLRSLGLRVTVFVDDFLLTSKALHSVVDKDILLSTLSRLGIQINKEKSSLTPQHKKTYIGFIVSTEGGAPIISIPHNRIYKLKKDIRRVLSKTSVSARTLARVAGQCIAMTKAIIPGKLLL